MAGTTVLHGIDQSGLSTKRPARAYPGAIFYETDTKKILVWDDTDGWRVGATTTTLAVMGAMKDEPPGEPEVSIPGKKGGPPPLKGKRDDDEDDEPPSKKAGR